MIVIPLNQSKKQAVTPSVSICAFYTH